VSLSGISEPITALKVKINQVDPDSCPNPTDVTAYVSVTDQGGYPVAELEKVDFSVVEGIVLKDITDFGTVSQAPFPNITVAVVMDYSGSITSKSDVVDDMEENVSEFINQLGAADEAEIVKFGDEPEVVQEFTSNKDILTSAIFARFNNGRETSVYDAVKIAVDHTSLRSKDRKAVIVVTDGEDTVSTNTLDSVISNAQSKGIPIFTLGIGDFNIGFLEQMSGETGGLFYKADNSDNTRTVFQQLADLLFTDQYVITYQTSLSGVETAYLEIEATLNLITGDDARAITPCP
jgi:VWFA-related protein